jgi:hypothetical protein
MTDHTVVNGATQKAGALLDYANDEGELSASIVEQLRQAPTLRGAARQMLVDALARSTRFPNPDAMFIHRKNTAGFDPEPLTLTQALLYAFIGNRTHLDDEQALLSTRRDSAHPSHAVMGWDVAAIRTLFQGLLTRLQSYFKFTLNEYWTLQEQSITPIPGEEAVTGTRDEVLKTLQSSALHRAVRLAAGKGELDGQDQTRLQSVVDDDNCKGRYALSLRTSEGVSLPLIGSFVATATNVERLPLVADGNSAPVYLFTPAGGVEKFSTLEAMETALHDRLGQEESRELLSGYLSLEHQLLLAEDSAGSLALEYSALNDTPAARFITSLQERQITDFDYLLAQALLSSGDADALLEMFDDVSRVDDLEHALNVRYLDLLAFVQERSLPDWLTSAPAADRQRYDELAREQAQCEERVQAELAGIESPEIYARREIAGYLMKHLGYTFDPSSLTINLPDEMPFAHGPLRTVYKNTLLGFALDGMPDVELHLGPGIQIDPAYSHLHLNFDFVCRLVRDLDLKRRYGREVERRYREQTTLKAMSALRASDIAVSAWAAKLQGHLSDQGQALIARVQANLGRDSTLKLGALYLKGGNRRFEDVVVLREIRGKDEFYVLYAPGHPSGRELFDFATWSELSFAVRSWVATPQGAQYLLDQTVVKPDLHVVPYIAGLQLESSDWTAESVQFVAINGSFLTDALAGFSWYKMEQVLARDPTVSSTRMQHVTDPQRTAQVLLDLRVAELNKAYDKFGIMPWREAARHECERLIDAHLKASGVTGRIDPDTVFCDLENKTGDGQPDFGRYTKLICLTDLFMAGYSEEEYTFHPAATLHSSIGQNVSALSGAFIDDMLRGSNYADEYITQLRRHTWSLTNNPRRDTKAFFSRKTHYEMRRDALVEYTAGRVTLDQYHWLVKMIASLDGSIAGNTLAIPGTFHRLLMKRKTLVGVYIFKPDAANARYGTLAYTPGAPDGLVFRKEDDVVRSVSRPGMLRYYYDRANFRAQGTVGPFLQALEQSPVVFDRTADITHSLAVSSFENLHDLNVRHLIVDIDAQTESVNERRLLRIYNFVRKHGGHLANLNPKAKLVWIMLHATVDLFRGIYAYQDGNHERAKGFFIDAAQGAFDAARQARKVRKSAKKKRLNKAKKNPSGGSPRLK